MHALSIEVLPGNYLVCKFPLHTSLTIPEHATFFSLTRTPDELSLICEETDTSIASAIAVEKDWQLLSVKGIFSFGEIGIIAKLSKLFADASISIMTISSYNTDYILIPKAKLEQAIAILQNANYTVIHV